MAWPALGIVLSNGVPEVSTMSAEVPLWLDWLCVSPSNECIEYLGLRPFPSKWGWALVNFKNGNLRLGEKS